MAQDRSQLSNSDETCDAWEKQVSGRPEETQSLTAFPFGDLLTCLLNDLNLTLVIKTCSRPYSQEFRYGQWGIVNHGYPKVRRSNFGKMSGAAESELEPMRNRSLVMYIRHFVLLSGGPAVIGSGKQEASLSVAIRVAEDVTD